MTRRRKVLVLDVGGTHVKLFASETGDRAEFASGSKMTPRVMVAKVKRIARDLAYDCVAIGYPGVVVHGRVASDPQNLGKGWAGFDFERVSSGR